MNTPRENINIPLGDFPSSGRSTEEVRSATPPLTGGSGDTKKEKRDLPEVEIPEPKKSYGQLLIQGFDSYQEAINLKVPPALIEILEERQEAAKALEPRSGQAVTVELGAETLQVWPCGSKGGVRWVLEGDDFLLMFRNPAHDWCLSVRYLSAGIWEHGMRSLRARVRDLLQSQGCIINREDGVRVSRADWAFDIYSPRFTAEMLPSLWEQVVCHSSVKATIVGKPGAGNAETLTIGKTSATLQIQIYDKSTEIKESSGKTWMEDLWLMMGWEPEDGELANVWRVEVRMGKEWLKERKANTPEELDQAIIELVGEALITHRLTEPSATDTNRARWPMHPLFAICWHSLSPEKMMPLGRHVEGTREILLERLKRQIAGTMRSGLILATGNHKPEDAEILAAEAVMLMLSDPKSERKAEAARERYKYVEEAK